MDGFADNIYNTIKGLVKIVLQSRKPTARRSACTRNGKLLVLGNGPSLSDVIQNRLDYLLAHDSMAVNFAANAPEFSAIAPRHYMLADPHFFIEEGTDANVDRLWQSLNHVSWPMTLYVPCSFRKRALRALDNGNVDVRTFNFVGVGGFKAFRHFVYRRGWGMPRPRNVLVPAIMTAVIAGYKEIVLLGADHSWLKTLSVNDDNEVVSVQPHFYKEDKKEEQRVRHEYKGYRLHSIVGSFAVAFRSYHYIEEFARTEGVDIYNATQGSFIDAFRRIKI